MKLKVIKLGHGISSFVALVKMPTETYCQHHKLDDEIDLPDPLGHALMAAYPGVYDVLSYGSDGAAKSRSVTKVAIPPIDFETK